MVIVEGCLGWMLVIASLGFTVYTVYYGRGPAQDVAFFYTQSHFSEPPSCK